MTVQFSIVIPTYDRLEFLKETISSVEAQTYNNYEIIVVDDGSTDGTMDYLSALRGRVKALRQVNRGPASARNLGVRDAAGAYVAFLDSDDIWFPWTLDIFHKTIQKHDQPSLISAATVEFQGKVPNRKQAEFKSEWFCDFFESANDPAYVGSNALVVQRAVFDQAGGFDEQMSVGEDLDFYFRVGTRHDFVRVLSPVTLAYRRHTGNISTVNRSLYSAALELLTREQKGHYPGGRTREIERWKLLSRTVRPATLACLKSGLAVEAWQLFRKSLFMHVRLRRFRFLAGFALYGLLGLGAANRKERNRG